MRAFPGYYAFNSVYAMFPFTVPDRTRQILTTLGTVSSYSFDLPKKPPFSIATMGSMTYITDYHALIRIFNDQETFKEMWGPSIKGLTGTMYMLGGDTPETTDQHHRLYKEIFAVDGASKAMWNYFENLTVDLIKRKSYRLDGVLEVDAVREYIFLPPTLTFSIGNIAFGNFFGKLFGFPLKTETTPSGLVTEAELFEILAAIFSFLFNADEVWGMKLKNATVAAYKLAADLLKVNIAKVVAGGSIGDYIDGHKSEDSFMHLYGDNLIRRMVNDKKNSVDEVVTQVLLTAGGLANLSAEVLSVQMLISCCLARPNSQSLFVRRTSERLGRDRSPVKIG